MYTKVCNTDLVSHTPFENVSRLMCLTYMLQTDTKSQTQLIFHTTFPNNRSSFPPDTRCASIAPIQLRIVSLQVPTTEIRCRWDRCLLTQPLHNNEAPAE